MKFLYHISLYLLLLSFTLIKASEHIIINLNKQNLLIGPIDKLVLEDRCKEIGYDGLKEEILSHTFKEKDKKNQDKLSPYVIRFSFFKPFTTKLEKTLQKELNRDVKSFSENLHNYNLQNDLKSQKYKSIGDCTCAKFISQRTQSNILGESVFYNREILLATIEQFNPNNIAPAMNINEDQE